MLIFVYCLSVVFFCLGFFFSDLIRNVNLSIASIHEALAVMSDKQLKDIEKEKRVQAISINVFKQFLLISFKILLLLLVTVGPGFIGEYFFGVELQALVDFSFRVDVLLITTAVICAFVFIVNKIKKT